MRSTGHPDASAKRSASRVLYVPKYKYLSVFPLPVQASCPFLQLFQEVLRLFGVCFEQVVMYAPCVVSVLLEESKVVVPCDM